MNGIIKHENFYLSDKIIMRKYLIIIILYIIIFPNILSAQSIEEKIEVFNEVFKSNPELAVKKLDSMYSREKSKKLLPQDESHIMYAFAKYYIKMFKNDESLAWCKKGYRLAVEHKLELDIADYSNIFGNLYMTSNIVDSATYYYIKSAEILEKNKDFKAALVYNNIANIYLNSEDFYKAIPYLIRGIKQLEGFKDTMYLATLYGNISYCYEQVDSLQKANIYADKAIDYGVRYEQEDGEIYGLLTKAAIARKEGRVEESIRYNLKAYKISDEIGDIYRKGLVAADLSQLYATIDIDKSIHYGLEAEQFYSETDPRFLPKLQRSLGSLFMQKGDYKRAAYYQNEYITFVDSLKKAEYTTTQLELIEKYESAEKSRLISEQEKEIAVRNLWNTRMGFGLAILILLLMSLYLFYLNRVKSSKIKLELLSREKEIAISHALINGEGNERKRLAKEIHDGLANEIAGTKMYISALSIQKPELEATFQKLEGLLDQLHISARQMSHNILPKVLLDSGLKSSLAQLVKDYEGSFKINLHDESFNVSNKSKSFELLLFRIIQELVGNAIRHGKANVIDIEILDDNKQLELEFKDDGIGMTEEQANKGLIYLKDRIRDIHGVMSIDSQLDQGTTIKIKIIYGN